MYKKAALHSLGCKVNSYETEAMEELLINEGYEIVPFSDLADVYVINTCSVTNIADRKSRQMIHRAKKLNPLACVVATGCYIQNFGKDVPLDELGCDIIIGNNAKGTLIEKLNEYWENHESISDCPDINEGRVPYETLRIAKDGEHTRSFVKVQDGCNQFCSYCIIPYARGRIRSRDINDVMEELSVLASNGYREVVLTGIHLSSYGVDTTGSLIELIEEASKIDGIDRIRLGSLEPQIITQEFVDRASKIDKLCPHFHLSLQSGCDETLKRMNRKYTALQYKKACELIRASFADAAITTDVIVGFPGETEEEFEITKAFLEDIRFYEMHIFMYSKRAGTRAATMENQVADSVKKIRSATLIDIGNRMSKEYRQSFVGKELDVLLEEKVTIDGADYMIGFTPSYVKCAVSLGSGKNLNSNEIIRCKCTGFLSEDLLLVEF